MASYTQVYWSTACRILSACSGFEGVAPGHLNALTCTATGANTVSLGTGSAMVDGKWYTNTSAQDITIPSAVGGGNTRIDRIVLRANWAGFVVAPTVITGTDAASPTAPAITQTAGTTYDIKLYQALVDTSGNVTLTDERTFANRGVIMRQGGSSTIWSTAGTTNYFPTYGGMQAGAAETTGGSVTVTFPRAFAYAPVVFAASISGSVTASVTSVSATQAVITSGSATVYWLAIGPISW